MKKRYAAYLIGYILLVFFLGYVINERYKYLDQGAIEDVNCVGNQCYSPGE